MNTGTSTVLVLAAVAIGLLVVPRIVRAQQRVDAQVIDQLRNAGSDLSKPHPIDFFLYAPTQEAAERLAAKVRALNFEAKVEPAAQGAQWAVLATRTMVPNESALVAIRKQFDAMTAAEKGAYDGWGTEVVK